MQNSISDLIKGYVAGLTSRVLSPYFARITQGGGIYEAPQCVESALNSQNVLNNASFILIPSGYKGGTLYSELPINGNGDLTWTRGSDAFRTNASGLIQRVPWNLLQYSEDFSNVYWSKDAGVTVDTNVDLAPNGTTTADRLNLSTNGAVYRSGLSFGTGSFTLSVWLKGEGANIGKQVLLEFTNGNSTVTLTGDWQRFTTTGTNIINVAIKRAISGQATSVLAWGIQVVEGTTAQTYLPTTDRLNFPRLSYMYGSCPSALLEPQRTNLVLWSEDFTNAAWIKGAGVSVTANTTIAPDGNQTADTITFTGSSQLLPQVCLTIGTNVTTSVWLKGTAGETILVNGGGGADVIVTLTTSWQRISFNRASTTTTSVNISTFGGATARVLQVWGFQAEIGSYSTTYIPTTSATATRVADSFSRNNIYTNGLISASGGTWFVELRNNISYLRDFASRIGIGDTTGLITNSLVLNPQFGGGRALVLKYVAGVESVLYSTTTSTVKIAIKWNGTSCDVFANGTKVASASAFTTTIMENLIGSAGVPYFIQQMALFPTPISDTDCELLTGTAYSSYESMATALGYYVI